MLQADFQKTHHWDERTLRENTNNEDCLAQRLRCLMDRSLKTNSWTLNCYRAIVRWHQMNVERVIITHHTSIAVINDCIVSDVSTRHTVNWSSSQRGEMLGRAGVCTSILQYYTCFVWESFHLETSLLNRWCYLLQPDKRYKGKQMCFSKVTSSLEREICWAESSGRSTPALR